MYSTGLIVTSLGTVAIGIPMVKVIHMANEKKMEIKHRLPSIKEAILASLGKCTKENENVPIAVTAAGAGRSIATGNTKPATAPTTIPGTSAKHAPQHVPSSPPAIDNKSITSTSKLSYRMGKSETSNNGIDAIFKWIRSHPVTAVGAVVGVTVTVFKFVNLYRKYKIRRAITTTDDSQILQLYVSPPSFAFPRVSRSCIVLKAFLQLASIPYQEHIVTDPSLSPIGCLPFIRYKGRCEGSVTTAMEYLTSEYDVKMDHCFTDKERAIGDAVIAMLEYSKEAMQNHSIYMNCNKANETLYTRAVQAVSSQLEAVLDWVSSAIGEWTSMEEGIVKEAEMQDLQILREFQSVEHIIGKKSFLLGALPTTYDCAVYAVLKPIFAATDTTQFPGSLMYVRNSDVLARYVHRVSHAVYPDIHRHVNNHSSRSNGRSNGSRRTSLVY